MKHHVTIVRLWIEIALAGVIGSGELVIMKLYDKNINPIVGAYEYPLVVGFLFGIFGRGPVWIIGPATMLCLPIGTLVNLSADGDGFSLWPIALIYACGLALIGLIGAVIGRGGKKLWIKLFRGKS